MRNYFSLMCVLMMVSFGGCRHNDPAQGPTSAQKQKFEHYVNTTPENDKMAPQPSTNKALVNVAF